MRQGRMAIGGEGTVFRNCPGTPAIRGLQAVLSRKNIFDVRKVAHSPPYRGVPGHTRGGTWAVIPARFEADSSVSFRRAGGLRADLTEVPPYSPCANMEQSHVDRRAA